MVSSAKLPRADSTEDKSAFPGGLQFAVHQRHARSGWFPTCYEMLRRAAGVEGIDYRTFQDEFDLDIFDLDINLGHGQTQPRNNFVSVAQAVNEKYPQVQFEQKSFASGTKKTAFIDRCLAQQKPVLPSAAAGYE